MRFWQFFLVFLTCMVGLSAAANGHVRLQSYLVADLDSGKILKKKKSKTECFPASLTKMMTVYLIFEAIKNKRVSLNTCFKVSPLAEKQIRSKLWLKAGEKVPVQTLLDALIIKSANDAAVVVAEGLAKSVPAFVNQMNAKAKQLGMNQTHFCNPSGVPDRRQVSSAHDMAILVRALLKDFPEFEPLFRKRSFTWHKKRHETHNFLLQTLPGTTGMKTGYIADSGFNIATTVTRYSSPNQRRRFVCVFFGGKSGFRRDQEVIRLLEPVLLDENAVWYDMKLACPSQKGSSGKGPLLVRAPICSQQEMRRLLKHYEIHQEKLRKRVAARDMKAFLLNCMD